MDSEDRRERLWGYRETIDRVGTPLYVFFEDDLRASYRELRSALDAHYPDSRIHFAAKANYNLGVLSVLRDEGCGAEAYARCELSAVLEAGFDAADVLLTGMNRRQSDVERALAAGVEHVLVDNRSELERVEAAAAATGDTPSVLLRGNPAMDVPTAPDIATATRESKFGLDIASGRAMAVARAAADSQHVDLAGLQLHIGSQLGGTEPYDVAARELLSFAAEVRDATGVEIEVLDLGGGFPVQYGDPVPGPAAIVRTLSDAIAAAAETHGLAEPRLFLEPGRRLVATAGALLGTVGVVKETPHATFAVLDVGTNAVSSHWPYPIVALSGGEPTEEYHVAGPLCYSGDVIQESVALPPLDRGDRLAVDRVGAYSLGSASHTNAAPKPPVLLVRSDGTVDRIRRGESCEDVLGSDEIPGDLR
jgi:diaminopimelate decarboxylase